MIRWMIAVLLLVGVPALLLWDRTPVPPATATVVRPVVTVAPGRRLFGGGLDDPSVREVEAGTEAGVPVLVGIAGRLPDAAVALVRAADGHSRSVAVGAMAGDWRLEGLAADQAVFSRGDRRVRVRMAVADDEGAGPGDFEAR